MNGAPFVFSAHNDSHQQLSKKPPDPLKQSSPKLSFRDKLLGPSQNIPPREKEDMIAKKLVRIELEDGNRLLPKVYIEPKVFQDLCTPWKDAIVVKLLGKTLGYNTMKERLQKIWKLQGGFEIMNNDNGFYMVKFDHAADKEKVITGGPWLIYDRCLAVSHWSPEFASPNAKIERTVVWVRFPGLNLVYYDESFLMAMASAIGRPIKVDINTLNVERGRFARVCVEVDLTVPVVGKIWVNGHWYKVQYEGLHIICTNCGCYGHLGRNCPLATPVSEAAARVHQNHSSAPPHTNSQVSQQKPNSSQPQPTLVPQNGNTSNNDADPRETNKERNPNDNEGSKELHGDWLLVTRRKKPPNQPSSSAPKIDTHVKSNKFNALANLPHQPNYSSATPKLPPRPHATNIARPNKGNADPKRRRHEDDNNQVITTSPVPTNTTTKTHNNPNKSVQYPITPVPFQSNASPHIVFDPKHLDPSYRKSTTHASPIIDQHIPSHAKDYDTVLTPINLSAAQPKHDPPVVPLSPDVTHQVDADFENCEEIHVRASHDEEAMVT
ncbi:hypothetical protein A2U01_0000136 [Trifolium medium]|uniref:CCHC-type domain-containing protein n=1 Tax=Trifolium medium TaxID=97028 RepID=A0A392LWP8_9FABA|nr:hypothetical protein [Trifolium medium]